MGRGLSYAYPAVAGIVVRRMLYSYAVFVQLRVSAVVRPVGACVLVKGDETLRSRVIRARVRVG